MQLEKSIPRTVSSGEIEHFPDFADLVRYLVARGLIRGLEDLYGEALPLLNDITFDWVRVKQLGCQFAVQMAGKPDEYRWRAFAVEGALRADVDEVINSVIDVAWEQSNALSIVFPDIAAPEQIVALINKLCSTGRWYWVDVPPPRSRNPDDVLVGLRWVSPSDACTSFVLGFAPLDTLPFTRRAPLTFLSLFASELSGPDYMGNPRKKENGRWTVHLADIPLTGWTKEKIDRYNEATTKHKMDKLASELTFAAKARVTFRLSRRVAEFLCRPTPVD